MGPTTVQRMLGILGCLPTVRFGSTETCLQVLLGILGREGGGEGLEGLRKIEFVGIYGVCMVYSFALFLT